MPAVPPLLDCLAAVAALRSLGGGAGAADGCPIARVLAEGRLWPVPARPPRLPRLAPGECFRNAALLALTRPGWIYAEGYARRRSGVVRHAWLLDPRGRVGDPTWGWEPAAEYAGIAFPAPELRRRLAAQSHYGLLLAADGAPPRRGAAECAPPPLP